MDFLDQVATLEGWLSKIKDRLDPESCNLDGHK